MPTVARTLRVARRIVRSAAGQTDHGRWRILAQNPHYSTDLRNRAVGELVPPGSSVLDLGCGVQTLRRFLPADTEYQPCDLVEDVPGVLYCDFNAGIRPAITKKFDFAVCSGVLEFLREPKDFLRRAPELGRTLILAYFPLGQRGRGRIGRLKAGYINHFTRPQLESLLDEVGHDWSLKWDGEEGQIYLLGWPSAGSP